VDQLGPNALGEVLEPGRVADCYLGLLLPPGSVGEPEAGTILIIAPAALLHPRVPQPDGGLVYELLTGHPEREAGELVFVADLTGELRAWPHDTWAKLGVDPDQVAQAVIGCWQDGEVTGLQVDDLGFEEARSLTRPAMTYVRGQLRGRLTAGLVASIGAGCIPPAAADPAISSSSHRFHRADTDTAVRLRCPEPGRHGGGHIGSVRQDLPQHRSWSRHGWLGVAIPVGHRPCRTHLEAVVGCGTSSPGPHPLRSTEAAMSRWLPASTALRSGSCPASGERPGHPSGLTSPQTPAWPPTPA
jgi:hypothetical protein